MENLMESKMENDDLVVKISQYGDVYRRKYLCEKYNKKDIENDWLEALKFFLGRAYFQGRKDVISNQVLEKAFNKIEILFNCENKITKLHDLNNNEWIELDNNLSTVIGRGRIGKRADIDMTISAFKFIYKLTENNFNITKYSIDKVERNELEELYKIFQYRNSRENGIFSVGPKISSFYLRDLISLYELDGNISNEDLKYLQPIDTWVRKLVYEIRLIDNNNENDNTIREKIVEVCNNNNISSLKFNQGAWYIGYNSFEIVLQNISKGLM